MPSDQELQTIAEEWKTKGNDLFSKSKLEDAIKAYSQGLVQVDRLVVVPVLLKSTLLSNRAACYLKQGTVEECKDDCDALFASVFFEELMLKHLINGKIQ